MAGGAAQQAEHVNLPVRRHREFPLACAVAQRAGQSSAVSGLQLHRGERARRARRQLQTHRVAGRCAVVVHPVDGHRRCRVAGVDEAKQAALVFVAGGVEDHHLAAVGLARRAIVQRSQEPAGQGAGVHGHVHIELRRQMQAPVSPALAEGACQRLVRVSSFQIAGIEVDLLARLQAYRHRVLGRVAGVVEGVDSHVSTALGAVGQPH